jgi:hypothetical protein
VISDSFLGSSYLEGRFSAPQSIGFARPLPSRDHEAVAVEVAEHRLKPSGHLPGRDVEGDALGEKLLVGGANVIHRKHKTL